MSREQQALAPDEHNPSDVIARRTKCGDQIKGQDPTNVDPRRGWSANLSARRVRRIEKMGCGGSTMRSTSRISSHT